VFYQPVELIMHLDSRHQHGRLSPDFFGDTRMRTEFHNNIRAPWHNKNADRLAREMGLRRSGLTQVRL
jgi:hypothetical protein